MLGGALNVGVTPLELKEILYQAVPYVGIARVFDVLHATNEILGSRGVALPLEGQSTTTPETRHRDGLTMQKAIFGDVIDTMYASSPENQLHIQQYLSANCFGDYYTRTGLDIRTRERRGPCQWRRRPGSSNPGQRAGSSRTLTAPVRRESFSASTAWFQRSSGKRCVMTGVRSSPAETKSK